MYFEKKYTLEPDSISLLYKVHAVAGWNSSKHMDCGCTLCHGAALLTYNCIEGTIVLNIKSLVMDRFP